MTAMIVGIASTLQSLSAPTSECNGRGVSPLADRVAVELVEPGVSPAPIHYDSARLDVAGTAALVARVRASVARAASAALDEIASALPAPVRSISLRAWPLDFPAVLHGPRATLGPPWTRDHRVALAATIVSSH